jgi:hypothetical protein
MRMRKIIPVVLFLAALAPELARAEWLKVL